MAQHHKAPALGDSGDGATLCDELGNATLCAGARSTPVLLGLHVLDQELLKVATTTLVTEGFVFAELPENSRAVFERFLKD